MRTGMEAVQTFGHEGAVASVAISGNGRRVLTGSSDKTAALWEAEPGG